MANELALALAALNRALQHRPQKDGTDFATASMHLAALRDQMIARGDKGARLEQVNAVLSVVMGGHFPLGKIPWPSVQAAHDMLARLAAPPPA